MDHQSMRYNEVHSSRNVFTYGTIREMKFLNKLIENRMHTVLHSTTKTKLAKSYQ
ncbi:hypothetical protein C0J52_13585 [Blattella germanica]|nr:hypothetical protein C0J52_13585 [Blattella germanica]